MQTNGLNIALIGCGRISFKHIEAFVAMQDKVDLVAVCDPVVERAEEKKAEYTKTRRPIRQPSLF